MAACVDLPGMSEFLVPCCFFAQGEIYSAYGLSRAGINVTLFEAAVREFDTTPFLYLTCRFHQTEFAEIGAGVGLGKSNKVLPACKR